jgi:predicted thioesterase
VTSSADSTQLTFTVTDDDTAAALGSGDVPVLATPRLVAWIETVTCASAAESGAVGAGNTTVGIQVNIQHLMATGVGGTVTVTCRPPTLDGRQLNFTAEATDGAGARVATAQITRVVVNRERFLARLPPQGP